MKKYIMAGVFVAHMTGCSLSQHNLDENFASSKHTQVIVNDFVDYLRSSFKSRTWFKIDGKSVYTAKLRSTAIRKGLKVCIQKCPTNAITFKTLIQRIDGNLLEAALTTKTSVYHRMYKVVGLNNIKRFSDKTVYKK